MFFKAKVLGHLTYHNASLDMQYNMPNDGYDNHPFHVLISPVKYNENFSNIKLYDECFVF